MMPKSQVYLVSLGSCFEAIKEMIMLIQGEFLSRIDLSHWTCPKTLHVMYPTCRTRHAKDTCRTRLCHITCSQDTCLTHIRHMPSACPKNRTRVLHRKGLGLMFSHASCSCEVFWYAAEGYFSLLMLLKKVHMEKVEF
jgi:hypothetical protein